MNLVGRNHPITTQSITETIRFFQRCGYDGLELSVLRGMSNVVLLELLEDYAIRRVREAVAEQPGFHISALSCHANYVTDDFIYDVQKRLLRTARAYGTDIVILSTFVPYAEREARRDELYAELTKRTAELCRAAEGEGVRIAVEVEPNQLFANLDTFLDMAERLRSPALKLNFDIGHMFLSEESVSAAAQRAREYIVHGHIDNMRRGEHCHLLPWDGEIDLVAACGELRAAGFDGDLALDLYLQDYVEVSPACVRYLRDEVFAKLA